MSINLHFQHFSTQLKSELTANRNHRKWDVVVHVQLDFGAVDAGRAAVSI